MVAGSLSASTRRVCLVLGVAALLGATSSLRAQPPQDAPDPLKLTGDYVMLLDQVKPDKTAEFESAWTTIKDKLSKSDKADWKELGDSIKIFKLNTTPAAGAPVVYLFQLNPPSKTLSYEPVKILYSSGLFERAEADAIYKKISDGFAGITPWPLTKVVG